MTTAASPWTTKDHNGPATPKGQDTDKDTATDDAPAKAPVNPLLSIGQGQQLPKGDRRG